MFYDLKDTIIELGFKSVSYKEGTYKLVDSDGIVYVAYWGSYTTNYYENRELVCIDNSITKKISRTADSVESIKEIFEETKKNARRNMILNELLEE